MAAAVTRSTRASGGAWASSRPRNSLTHAALPSTSANTPSTSLPTHPASPSRVAREYTKGRKPTPCTTPSTRTDARTLLVTRPVCRPSPPASGRPAGAAIKQVCRNHRYEERSPYHENSRLWAAMPGLAGSRPSRLRGGGASIGPRVHQGIVRPAEVAEPPDGFLRAHLRQVPGGSGRAGERHAERHGHVVPAGPGVGIQVDLCPDGDRQWPAAWQMRASDGSTVYVAAQGPPYPLRLTKGSSRADFTQWNSVTIPPPPPASQIVDLSQLTGSASRPGPDGVGGL